jgi:hypothetical protein
MKKLLLPALVVAAFALFQLVSGHHSGSSLGSAATSQDSGSALSQAFASHSNGVVVQGEGEVVKVLSDDDEGSRHQRFIVRVGSGQTVLIAHNIDLAPRVSPLHEGDSVSFSGEYAWNSKGGVVHWTHRDPRGQHSAGWIRHDGQVFQ